MTKQEKIDKCREWLIEEDVEFLEYNHGHFKVHAWGKPVIEFWATTEKFTIVGTNVYQVGWHLIQKAVKRMKAFAPNQE